MGMVLGIVMLPVWQILPKAPFIKIGQCLFKFGYNIYLTSCGACIHRLMSMAAGDQLGTAHRKVLSPTVLKTCTVWPVPILFDNYAYLIIDHRTKCAVP